MPRRRVAAWSAARASSAELWQGMRKASAGKVQVVFLTGEPGIGKTALADEFQRQVAASNRTVRFGHGQCVEGFGSKEAFYPVLEAVGRLCRGPDGARVVDTLATEAPTWLVQFPALLTRQHRETLRQEILGATRERMLREICEALAAVSVRSPLLLVLEDLHWGDSSTLDLISALARHRAPARIMLLATYRPSEVAGSTLPLDGLKRDLVARHLGREIVLPPLTDAEIAQYLAEGQSAATVPEELASLLHRHTEGNPLFMIAVLEHMLEAGLVEHEDGGWRLRRPASEIAVQVPETLRQMIGAQIERLSAPEQRVLEVAAIAGMTFVAAISGPHGQSGSRLLRRVLRRARETESHPAARGHPGAARRTGGPALRVRARALPGGALRAPGARAAGDAAPPRGRADGGALRRQPR